MTRRVVAIVGTRFENFGIEEQILGPLDVEIRSGAGRTAEDLLAIAGEADVVLAGGAPRFGAEVIGGLKARGIVRYGIGVDTIDLGAARKARIWVARVPDYGTQSVAFHSVTMALAALRRLVTADGLVKAGHWDFSTFRPLRLPSSLTAGVLGFGRIGREAAKYLAAFGFRILSHDADADAADASAEFVGFEELLRRSDVLLLHLPGREDGVPLIGRRELALLPEGAVVVNTARGSVLDTDALIEALASGHIAHAGLDVFPKEPLDAAIFAPVADRVTLTPHMAWYTQESEREMRVKTATAAACILRGEAPPHAVVTPEDA